MIKKRLNKLLCAFLALVMVLAMLPSQVFADVNLHTTPSSTAKGQADGQFQRKGLPDGYRVSVYFALKMSEKVVEKNGKSIIEPIYGWEGAIGADGKELDVAKNVDYFKIGRSIDIRRTALGGSPSFWGTQDVFQYINGDADFMATTSGSYVWSEMGKGLATTERYNEFYQGAMLYREEAKSLSSLGYDDLTNYLNGITKITYDTSALPDYISDSGNAKPTEWTKGYFSHPLTLEHLSYLTSTKGGTDPWHYTNFIDGTYYKDGKMLIGQYKLYIEPLYYALYGTNNYGCMSLREMIAAEKKGLKISPYDNATRRPWTLARAMVLEHKDLSLRFKDGSGVAGSMAGQTLPKEFEWSKVKSQLAGNTAIGNYAGVGVITSPSVAALKGGTKVVRTFVEVDTITEGTDGKKIVTYKEAAPSDVSRVIVQDNGTTSLAPYGEKENMIYVLNDVVVTSKDITGGKDTGELSDVHWDSVSPKSSTSSVDLSKDKISSYLFGRVISSGKLDELITLSGKEKLSPFDLQALTMSIGKIPYFLGDLPGFVATSNNPILTASSVNRYTSSRQIMSSDMSKQLMDITARNEGSGVSTTPHVITDLTNILVEVDKIPTDNAPIIDVIEGADGVDETQEGTSDMNEDSVSASNKKSSISVEESYFINNKKTTTAEPTSSSGGNYHIIYARYIVSKSPKQINIITTKEDGVPVGSPTIVTNELDVHEYTQLEDIRKEGKYSEAKLINYYTNTEYNTVTIPPSDGHKEGTTLDPIKDLFETENVYVFWEIEKTPPSTPSADYTVPQWRLSRMWDNILEGSGATSMTLNGVRTDSCGCCGHYAFLRTEGNWSYHVVNPNDKIVTGASSDNTPENMKFKTWLHSKAIGTGEADFVYLNKTGTEVRINGNLNAIKSTDTSGLKVANWLNSGALEALGKYDIQNSAIPATNKVNNSYTLTSPLNYRTKNDNSYVNGWYVCSCWDDAFGGHHHGHSYGNQTYFNSLHPANITYIPYTINPNVIFERYNQQNTDTKKLLIQPEVTSTNTKTTLKYQLNKSYKIYPEYGMLFANDEGKESIKWVVGDQARLVNPVVYQTLEHKVYVDANSNGTSVVTDSRAISNAKKIGE